MLIVHLSNKEVIIGCYSKFLNQLCAKILSETSNLSSFLCVIPESCLIQCHLRVHGSLALLKGL